MNMGGIEKTVDLDEMPRRFQMLPLGKKKVWVQSVDTEIICKKCKCKLPSMNLTCHQPESRVVVYVEEKR